MVKLGELGHKNDSCKNSVSLSKKIKVFNNTPRKGINLEKEPETFLALACEDKN